MYIYTMIGYPFEPMIDNDNVGKAMPKPAMTGNGKPTPMIMFKPTVDGTNPVLIDGLSHFFLGFQPSKVVQDFFHPQYDLMVYIWIYNTTQ